MYAVTSLPRRLSENPVHRKFTDHEFFGLVKNATLRPENVLIFLAQWWHPLHYFPTFLARSVAVLPDIESKGAITRILNQEVGGGRPERAHEVIYVDTMIRAGFNRERITGMTPFSETAELVEGYEHGSESSLSALGYIFATEVTDLLMVSSIGAAVERSTGVSDLEWVRIHLEQEPDHVEEATRSILRNLSPDEEAIILTGAEEMWRLWHHFFDRLTREISTT